MHERAKCTRHGKSIGSCCLSTAVSHMLPTLSETQAERCYSSYTLLLWDLTWFSPEHSSVSLKVCRNPKGINIESDII